MVGFPAIAERVGLIVKLANLAGASLLRVEANVLIRRVDQLKLCALLQRKRKRVQLESLGKRELKSEA